MDPQVFISTFKAFLKRTNRMAIYNNDIIKTIVNLLKVRFDVKENLLVSENYHFPLTGELFHLTAVDLVYLLFEVEDEFKIRIPPDSLKNYGFFSVNAIASAVQKEIG